MKAELKYKFNNKDLIAKFEAQSIRFITSGSPDYRLYMDDEFKFSVSPSIFISFEIL